MEAQGSQPHARHSTRTRQVGRRCRPCSTVQPQQAVQRACRSIPASCLHDGTRWQGPCTRPSSSPVNRYLSRLLRRQRQRGNGQACVKSGWW
jgi:hypothetical protein